MQEQTGGQVPHKEALATAQGIQGFITKLFDRKYGDLSEVNFTLTVADAIRGVIDCVEPMGGENIVAEVTNDEDGDIAWIEVSSDGCWGKTYATIEPYWIDAPPGDNQLNEVLASRDTSRIGAYIGAAINKASPGSKEEEGG